MKAELHEDGYIVISPNTVAESFALQYLTIPSAQACDCCGRHDINYPVMFNLALENGIFPHKPENTTGDGS